MYLNDPGDPVVSLTLKYQFMLRTEWLVTPVVKNRADVLYPEGSAVGQQLVVNLTRANL